MAFCSSCGTALPDYAKFCSSCGKALEPFIPPTEVSTTAVPIPENPSPYPNPPYAPSAPYNQAVDIAENKLISILCYFGPLVLVAIFMMKNSRYARFHANQGLLLFIFEVAGAILVGIVGSALYYSSVYFLATLLWTLFWISIVILLLLGITNAASGREKRLPVLGRFNIIK